MDTTSIDNAAYTLEAKSYYIRKAGSDGFKIGHQPTLKKAVNDRRASLDEETEIKPAVRKLVEDEFHRGASIPDVPFPRDGAEVPDTPRLTLVVAEPEAEWTGSGSWREHIAEWTKQRAGHSSSGETLCGRVISALKSAALLNESVGAGYIDRNWPPALKESGAWPLASLLRRSAPGVTKSQQRSKPWPFVSQT